MVRCFYGAKEISKQAGKQARSTGGGRGDLSVSVHTTAMVFQREKIISGNTSAMVEEIEPISYHCDGPTAMV